MLSARRPTGTSSLMLPGECQSGVTAGPHYSAGPRLRLCRKKIGRVVARAQSLGTPVHHILHCWYWYVQPLTEVLDRYEQRATGAIGASLPVDALPAGTSPTVPAAHGQCSHSSAEESGRGLGMSPAVSDEEERLGTSTSMHSILSAGEWPVTCHIK